MRPLKSQGGLTRESGMSEHQRTVWVMSSTVPSAYNLSMQELTVRSYGTSEQHKELSAARVRRDETDLSKFAENWTVLHPSHLMNRYATLSQGLMPISRLSSRFLVKPCAAIYCFCTGYLGLERSWGSNESSTENSQ